MQTVQVAQWLPLQQDSNSEGGRDDQQTSQAERGCSPRWCNIAYSFPGLHKHHNHSARTCVKHPACRWFAVWCAEEHTTAAVHYIQNTINEVCSWTESWALQLNTTKTVSTLHTAHCKGEGLTKIKQPASSNVSWGNPRYTFDMEVTYQSSWSQGYQETGHYEETCRNHLRTNSGILKQVYTGAVRPVVEYASTTWKTTSKINKSKQDRVQTIGFGIILGATKSTPIQEMEKFAGLQPLECRREYNKAAIQKEKAEETDQSSTPPETSTWNQKAPEKKELQAQVEGPTKRKCWSSEDRSRKVWGTHNQCLCTVEESFRKSELKF